MTEASNIARIQELLGAPRRFRLQFSFNVYSLPVLSALFLGVVLGPALAVPLHRWIHTDAQLLAFTGLVIVLTIMVRVLFIARRQGNVELELDSEGIRELDDGVVRVEIPWEKARASAEAYRAQYGSRSYIRVEDHVDIRFASPDGDIITVTDHDRTGLFPRCRFRCVTRRALAVEKQVADLLPAVPKDLVDRREKEEHGSTVARFFRRLTFLLAWFALIAFCSRLHEGPQQRMPEAIRFLYMIAWALPPGLELIAQVKRWSRWRVSVAPPEVVTAPYRASGRERDHEGYARLMKRRALRFVAARGVLFLIVAALPWLAGYAIASACEASLLTDEDPSYYCH